MQVINLFALLSILLLLEKQLKWSMLAFAVSVYIKASLLIFVPIWLIFALKQKYKASKWITAFSVTSIFILLATVPFADKNVGIWLSGLYKDKVFSQQLHVITANAFNVWAGMTGILEQPDTMPFLGLSYKLWSYVLFLLSYIHL